MSENQDVCEYTETFTDFHTKEPNEYSCPRPALPSGLCEFHDKDFLAGNEGHVRQLFEDGLATAVNNQQELFCIGYHLPNVELHNLVFQEAVYFVNTKFHGKVDIINSSFTFASFDKSKFSQNANFLNLDFQNNFIFTDVKCLNGNVDFKNVNFNQNSSFTRFKSKNVLFDNCDFSVTNFRGSKFSKSSRFLDSTFSMKTNFSGLRFDGETDFSNSTFAKNTDFKFTKFNAITKFHNVDFKEQKLVAFEGDLSNTSFRDTDVTRIKFDEKIIWGRPDRYEIYDARELIRDPESGSLGHVLSTYRNLRENYEFRLMYEEAGKFFVKEMELKRNYFEDLKDNSKTKLKPVCHRYLSLTSFYSHLCLYGESLKRPAIWASLILFLAMLHHNIFPDIHSLEKELPLGIMNYTAKIENDVGFRLEISLERTLSTFFQLKSDDLIDYLIRIASIPVLGTIFIVLRRRFERRFRH